MENQKIPSNENAAAKIKPFKYGRIYWYIFIVICLVANFYLWKPILKYFKLL